MNYRMLIVLIGCLLLPQKARAVTGDDVDFNKDGMVNFTDFIAFAVKYNSVDSRYDVNKNGRVDFPDFLEFVRWYGTNLITPLRVIVTTFPDTLFIGTADSLGYFPDPSTIKDDVISFTQGLITKADSISVTTHFAKNDNGWLGQKVIIEAKGNPGSHKFQIVVGNFGRVFRDTINFVVSPKKVD